jgi:hypothetical protein
MAPGWEAIPVPGRSSATLQRVHLPKGRGLPQPARAEAVPVGAHWMLPDAPYALGNARLQEVEADIVGI